MPETKRFVMFKFNGNLYNLSSYGAPQSAHTARPVLGERYLKLSVRPHPDHFVKSSAYPKSFNKSISHFKYASYGDSEFGNSDNKSIVLE